MPKMSGFSTKQGDFVLKWQKNVTFRTKSRKIVLNYL